MGPHMWPAAQRHAAGPAAAAAVVLLASAAVAGASAEDIGASVVAFVPPTTLVIDSAAAWSSTPPLPERNHTSPTPGAALRVLVNAKLEAECPVGAARVCEVELPAGFAGGGATALSVALYASELQSTAAAVVRGDSAAAGDGRRAGSPAPALRLLTVAEGPAIRVVDAAGAVGSGGRERRSGGAGEADHGHGADAGATVAAAEVTTRPRVLLYNTVENAPQAVAAQRLAAAGHPVVTIEGVVQSGGNITCSELGGNCGIYHATPLLLGSASSPYYCWWRRRPGSNGSDCAPLPGPCTDCPDIPANARFFADLWHRTGVDVVVPDTTNLRQRAQRGADVLNVRPVEVLAEEFTALRAAGVATPDLAVWAVAAANTTMAAGMLGVVNEPATSGVWLREPSGGKAVVFVHGDAPLPPDAGVVAALEANSGARNVSVIDMWANFAPEDAAAGRWTFFQPCQRTPEPLDFTNTVLNDGYYRCNHLLSADKPGGGGLGTQMSLGASWQSYSASLPWASPSKLMGLTFQAMVDDALREKPDNVLLPSFDEWVAGPTPLPQQFWASQGCVGFPPSEQHVMFVDTFGSERSRTWAPTAEGGDFYLRLTQSCLRVLALAASTGATSCDVAGELCCNRTFAQFTRVFSLKTPNETDFLVTNSAQEASRVQQLGQYKQICASSLGAYSTDIFCYSPGVTDFEPRRGPFILYSLPTPPPPGFASDLHRGARVALHRCNGKGGHFVSASASCEGLGVQESVLGYASAAPHTGMPRLLRRCTRPASAGGVHYHTLDAECESGDGVGVVLGHVL